MLADLNRCAGSLVFPRNSLIASRKTATSIYWDEVVERVRCTLRMTKTDTCTS